MKSSLKRIALAAAMVALSIGNTTVTKAANDNFGKEWRQLIKTVGMSWTQVAALCPQDGVTPCTGALTGWTWATREQVVELFQRFDPTLVVDASGSMNISGPAQINPANAFLAFLTPTFEDGHVQGGCGYTGCISFPTIFSAEGWTASKDANGQPYTAKVLASFFESTATFGSFSVLPHVNPNQVDATRGAFLWHVAGQDIIDAVDDSGQVTAINGGTAIPNVLANDVINEARATVTNIQLTQVSSSAPGVTLNVANGAVGVAAGTPTGIYSLVYQICSATNLAVCDQATATVTVRYAIVANDDVGTASPSTGGVAVANVLVNDTLGGAVATTARVQLTQLSSTHAGISLDPATGRVNVAQGTPLGVQTLTYQICEIGAPTNCDPASVAVTVKHHVIDAVNDSTRASSKIAGVIYPNVLSNDRLGPLPATVSNVRLRQVSLTPATSYISLNVNTGAITLSQKVDSYTYLLVYEICEINAPTNCDTATVTLYLSGK